jgi:hypothetical protein
MHAHWRVIVRPILLTLLYVIPLLLILFTIFDTAFGQVLFWLFLIAGFGAWCWLALPRLVRWYARSYAVTTRRVLFRDGVVNAQYRQVELLAVANPKMDRAGLDVLFGTGNIDLGDDRVMHRVPRVVSLERLISQLAANQSKSVLELTHLLRSMGYTRLTTR